MCIVFTSTFIHVHINTLTYLYCVYKYPYTRTLKYVYFVYKYLYTHKYTHVCVLCLQVPLYTYTVGIIMMWFFYLPGEK